MASPTATSAAATAITIRTKTCADAVPDCNRERDERDVHAVEHQLERHQDDQQVSPSQDPVGPDREQSHAEQEVVGDYAQTFFLARTTDPNMATMISTETSSNCSP